jgi:tetratricopeptide (TPR) repeat protein
MAFASLYINVGATLLSQGKFEEALHALETAEKLAPRHVKALYNSGLAHWHLGHLETATAKFNAVLKEQPSHMKAIHAVHLIKTIFVQ